MDKWWMRCAYPPYQLALPPIIAQLYGAGLRAEVGREIHQGVWISLALVAVYLNEV